jgi:hypothetical protein
MADAIVDDICFNKIELEDNLSVKDRAKKKLVRDMSPLLMAAQVSLNFRNRFCNSSI